MQIQIMPALRNLRARLTSVDVTAALSALSRGPSVGRAAASPCVRIARMNNAALPSPLSRSDGRVRRKQERAAWRRRAEPTPIRVAVGRGSKLWTTSITLRLTRPVGLAALLLAIAGPTAAQTVGAPAPALVGQTIDGKPFDLAKLRGHVVVANVWATWCTPCRVEMPTLDAFAKAHRAEGVVLVGLSADRLRDAATVDRVMSAFSYPALLLKAAKTDGFTPPNVLPVTYVIDAKGIVRSALIYTDKPLGEADLDAAVAKAEHK